MKRVCLSHFALLCVGGAVTCAAGCKMPSAGSGHAVPAVSVAAIRAATPVRFRDDAAQDGLAYQWQVPGKRPLNILQTIGNGCAFLDYDNDGNLDILLVGTHPALYRGDGHGHFTNVTHTAGLDAVQGHFLGCAVGDYDGDGYDDVYLSGYRTGVLLHNERGRCFTDVTQTAGLSPQPWGTTCAWAETVAGSGQLDLFVANYVKFGSEPGIPQLCDTHGIMATCGPRHYQPVRGVFYKNLGGGRFVDASATMAVPSTSGRALGAAFAPLDGPERPALAISNDEMPGDLMVPKNPTGQHGTVAPGYHNAGLDSGLAFDRDGNIHGGMGVDWGDYANEGRLGLFVATFYNEAKSLYHNDGHGLFSDASYEAGIASQTVPYVAFGCKFFDADNDGWLDLMISNGHVQDNAAAVDSSTTYRQPTQLFHNRGTRPVAFDDWSRSVGPGLPRPIVGRGLAVGDYDNDGREDALVVDSEGKPLLLHNESAPVGHWLSIQLRGTRSNRDGLGAIVIATAGGRRLMRFCHTDGSYLSASDRRVHFGLGPSTVADVLRIHWPSGHLDVLRHLQADQHLTIREGGAVTARPWPGPGP